MSTDVSLQDAGGGRERGPTQLGAIANGEGTSRTAGPRALLSVRNVSVRFGGIVALDDISFEVEPNQVCGLIGPNGAGKSSLFNCVSGLYACETGAIEFDGMRLQGLRRHQLAGIGIGRTFQNLALFGSMSTLDNVLIGCHSRYHAGFLRDALRLPGRDRLEAGAAKVAWELIEYLQLSEVVHRPIRELPFGTQKRVELARALATDPKLLLLDEPASGLNHEEVNSLAALITDIKERLRVTILLVEHHMGLVMGVSNKIVALNFGKKIAEGSPAEVRANPDVIRAYLGHGGESAGKARFEKGGAVGRLS